MTQGKSLVEDMARAMAGSQSSVLLRGDDEQKRAAWREFARLGFAVLKDRLPADDRELVERLRRGPVWGNGESIGSVVGEINGATMNEAADRIIAYSAEAETYRQMHEIALELGYPSILEALEAAPRSSHDQP